MLGVAINVMLTSLHVNIVVANQWFYWRNYTRTEVM